MILRAAAVVSSSSSSSLSLFNANGENSRLVSPSKPLVSVCYPAGKKGTGLVVCAAKGGNNRALTGVVFEPFEEVKKELDLVPTVPQVSLARHKYVDDSEAAVNEQIKYVPFFFSLFLFLVGCFSIICLDLIISSIV